MTPDQTSPISGDHPCPVCEVPMVLFLIERAEPGYDKRTFKCAACGGTDAIKVKIEIEPRA
jgi:hypothetical protein